MYKFALPYNNSTPDKYIRMVVEPIRESVDEVYFSLPPALAGNARAILKKQRSVSELSEFIVNLGVPSNVVINSGFNSVSSYMPEELTRLIRGVELLVKAGLKRITLNNPFMMRTGIWKKEFPEVKFTASVNMNADTVHKVHELLTLFDFDEIVVDRAFNRDLLNLRKVSDMISKAGKKRKILVNEGCLLGCLFKSFHDQLIGQAHYFDTVGYQDYVVGLRDKYPDIEMLIPGLCDTYACGKLYNTEPWRILTSPFIRPEDLGTYADYADSFKISGRVCSTDIIAKRVRAYVDGGFKGNLMELLDAAPANVNIPNEKLDLNFTLGCTKVCSECGWCKEHYEKAVGNNA